MLIQYNRDLKIANLEHIAHGTGAKYLECISSPDGSVLIAKRWCRRVPETFVILVKF